tara:strand:+ start:223 stop:453 length:231 start_codon:yes stop_codon:yes gene_type:complete
MTIALEKLILSFFSDSAKVCFYPSAVDGTMCVEWIQNGRHRTETAINLGKSIMRHKRAMLKLSQTPIGEIQLSNII